jgi:hypothetical protein
MIIRDQESRRRYQAKRLTQSRSGQIADLVACAEEVVPGTDHPDLDVHNPGSLALETSAQRARMRQHGCGRALLLCTVLAV